jgi:nucleotide-binding universal stress UspA family protein
MFNKILVPLDGSSLAEAAVPMVQQIISGAKESRKIEVFLLQVVPSKVEIVPQFPSSPVRVPYSEAELDQINKSVTDYLYTISAAIKKDPNVTPRALVKVSDDPATEILKVSDELGIDLIVISTHGRSGISRWAYGSVADKILKGGNTPVFMVRAQKKAH